MNGTDKEIIQKILNGDVRSFGFLMERHKGKAMTLAFRILQNREDAEEALQDSFVRIYKALPSFAWKSSFSTWMYRIVYNTCMTAVAKKNQRSLFSSGREDESAQTCWVSGELLPDDIVESNEFATIVHEEVDKLPAVYGSTFTLFVLQAMSYEEITQVTGLPLGTVNARIFRARILLREAIVKRMNAVLG